MAYGGRDGELETGNVCFVRPSRSVSGREKRKYSSKDLVRIFRYVVAEEGLTAAYCAIANRTGIADELRTALDALRDIPCVDSDITELIPDDIKDQIEELLDNSFDELENCDPETNIGEKIKGAVAYLVAILIILRKILNNRLIKFLLRRIFILGLLVALANKLQDIIDALLRTAGVIKGIQEVLEVLACQRDENGNLKPISSVIDVPPELEALGL